MEETECIVCFSRYDEKENRPRSLPCGHTECTECLEKAIRELSKTCPKCRAVYSVSSVSDLPINFALEGVMKLLIIPKIDNGNDLGNDIPDCIEHLLPVNSRCSTHKAWVCQSCLSEDHSLSTCTIISITDELNAKKSNQIDKAQPFIKSFQETCKRSDDCIKKCETLIEKAGEEIERYKSMVKRLQEEIQRKKSDKVEVEKSHALSKRKLEDLKGKICSYNVAVSSLYSTETIKGVSQCSVEVQNEAKKLKYISNEMEREQDLMMQSAKAITKSGMELALENNTLYFKDNKQHLHGQSGKESSKISTYISKFADERDPPPTDGILTFLDIAWPGQGPRRIYMEMKGDTVRARQHLLLSGGYLGHSYRNLTFYGPNEKGQPGESFAMKPYDGLQAKPLFADVTVNDVYAPKTAGLVTGAGWNSDYNTALIRFILTDDRKARNKTGFGLVISGLNILKEIAKSDKRENIKVVDCGVVLPGETMIMIST